MSNQIQKELDESKGKMIDDFDYEDNKLVKLTLDNVAIVEAMIQNDSAYIRSTDKEAKPEEKNNGENKYGGSSAYWMTQLKHVLFNDEITVKYSYDRIIRGAVEAVDRENSTHLNADNKGREEITERICRFGRDKLLNCLKDPDYNNMELFREIAKRTTAEKGARENASFASKFCHYACFYVFEYTEYQDNYSIYDSIMKKVLPLYIKYYKVSGSYNLEDYKQYREAVDAIRNASGIEISRNGFDHLLWYYHKGRMYKLNKKTKPSNH